MALPGLLDHRQETPEDKENSLDLNSKNITIGDYCFNYTVPHFTNFSRVNYKMWVKNSKIIYHNNILIWITI